MKSRRSTSEAESESVAESVAGRDARREFLKARYSGKEGWGGKEGGEERERRGKGVCVLQARDVSLGAGRQGLPLNTSDSVAAACLRRRDIKALRYSGCTLN